MSDFNTLFPNFLTQCAELNRVLTPVAIVLFVVGIVSSTITGYRSPGTYLRTIARTCAYVALLASLLTWGSEVATAIDGTVKNTVQANPKQVHADYRVETSAGWNLQPGSGRAPVARASAVSPSVSANDAVIAEVNRQRAATRVFTEQTAQLNQRLGEMVHAAAQSQELAKQNLALSNLGAVTKNRLPRFSPTRRSRRSMRKPAKPPRSFSNVPSE